ncbi:hypothetical protein EDD64_1411, partial [Effusibacillus lacus]
FNSVVVSVIVSCPMVTFSQTSYRVTISQNNYKKDNIYLTKILFYGIINFLYVDFSLRFDILLFRMLTLRISERITL